MKIEKLNKDNIKEFIRDMKIHDAENLEFNINKNEFYGVKKDDIFCLGFNLLSTLDMIAIINYGPKLSDELFYECIDFLNNNLVARNHLIIELYNDKYIKLLDDKYKCREITVTYEKDENNIDKENIFGNNLAMKEKFAEIEMKSIKYYVSKDMVFCNLARQNIQDENIIMGLHKYFISLDVECINFVILPDTIDFFSEINYKCKSKNYIIR